MSLHGAGYGKGEAVTTSTKEVFREVKTSTLGLARAMSGSAVDNWEAKDILRGGNTIFSLPSWWARETENIMACNCFVKQQMRKLPDRPTGKPLYLWNLRQASAPCFGANRQIWAILSRIPTKSELFYQECQSPIILLGLRSYQSGWSLYFWNADHMEQTLVPSMPHRL